MTTKRRKTIKFAKFVRFGILLLIIFANSCSLFNRNETAVLWTDNADFAFYTEYFNAVQNRYKIETRFFEFPAQELTLTNSPPDIIVGNWLKSIPQRHFFRPLDRHFRSGNLEEISFYSRFFEMGRTGDRQYLLPVSFNAPAVIFPKSYSQRLSNLFTISLQEMNILGEEFNTVSGGIYTRMGFSPLWDNNFLFVIAALYNTDFLQNGSLSWNENSLDDAMNFVFQWNENSNGGIQSIEDFMYRFYSGRPSNLVLNGRILFSYLDSADFFTMNADTRANFDFRWLANENIIPINEHIVYMGLPRRGKSAAAAEAFMYWFFETEAQRNLLQRSHDFRMMETSFGISGGFSALRSVTEHIFPQFYPDLLGNSPPENFISPYNVLPVNWPHIKSRVVLPYLHERARQNSSEGIVSLERRFADWQRINW